MKNMSTPALVCGLLLLLPHAAGAQSENTEHVIVTATRLAGQDSGSNVSVIDAGNHCRARSRQRGGSVARSARRVRAAVGRARQRGVAVHPRRPSRISPWCCWTGSRPTIPPTPAAGSYDFSTLDLNDIERIEFVRGPASAIYGSDAVGGVINIITRHGSAAPEAALSAEGGSFGYARVAGHVSGPIGGATANLGLSYTDSGMPVDGSSLKGTNLDGALASARDRGRRCQFHRPLWQQHRHLFSRFQRRPAPCRCCAAWIIAISMKACWAPMPAAA